MFLRPLAFLAVMLVGLEGDAAGPPPAPPPALVIAPVLIAEEQGWSGTDHMSFSPDGRTLAVEYCPFGQGSGGLVFWEVASQRRRRIDKVSDEDGGGSWGQFVYTPDGRRLAVRTYSNKPVLWDLSTRKVVTRFPQEGEEFASPYAVAVSPDGRTLAVNWGKHVALWDLQTGKRLRTVAEDAKGVCGGDFSPDGGTLAVYDGDSVRLYDVATGRPRGRLRAKETPFGVLFSPCGRYVAALDNAGNHEARIWDARTGQLLGTWRRFLTRVRGVAFLGGGRVLAVGAESESNPWDRSPGRVSFWDAALRRECGGIDRIPDGVGHMAASPDGLLAVGINILGRPAGVTRTVFRVYRVLPPEPPGVAAPAPRFVPDAKAVLPPEAGGWWADLAGDDAEKAYTAVLALGHEPAVAVALLGGKLRPAAAPDRKRIAALVGDLGSDEFAARERASEELAKLGAAAELELRRVPAGAEVEVRSRVRTLLKAIEPPIRDGGRLRAIRSAEALEMAGTDDARRLLAWLATGAPEATLTREASASLRRLDARRRLAARR